MLAARLLWLFVLCVPVGVAAEPRPAARGPLTGDPTLIAAVAPLLEAPVLKGARLGLCVAGADGGAALLALDADAPLHPASNVKLLTTAAALVRLGPDFTLDTELWSTPLTEGRAQSLWLVGRGDPGLLVEDLWRLVDEAYQRGLRRVEGDLLLDESSFTPDHEAPGFDARTTDEAFRAPTGALSLNFNAVRVRVEAGVSPGMAPRITVDPASSHVRVDNRATTRRRGRPTLKIQAVTEAGQLVVRVEGALAVGEPAFETRRRVSDPVAFVGETLRALLVQRGIEVVGATRLLSGPPPAERVLLGRQTSRPVAWLVAQVNKYSNNFMAEQLLRVLGAVRRGRGGFDEGRQEIIEFLEREVGLGTVRLANGSGLFGDSAVTPAQLVRLLQWMRARRPALPEYDASLAIGGADGTLRKRMKAAPAYSVRAKTGTLDGVVALSGYTTFADGSPAAFSMLFNDVPDRPWDVWQVQDAVIAAIQGFTPPPRGLGR